MLRTELWDLIAQIFASRIDTEGLGTGRLFKQG